MPIRSRGWRGPLIGRFAQRKLAGSSHRAAALAEAGGRVVIGNQLRPHAGCARPLAGDHLRDLEMQLLALGLEERS
jgi:hypothetical protein